jgi:hypothetical protein
MRIMTERELELWLGKLPIRKRSNLNEGVPSSRKHERSGGPDFSHRFFTGHLIAVFAFSLGRSKILERIVPAGKVSQR